MKYAGFWRRLGAHIIDSVLLFGVEWLIELALFGAFSIDSFVTQILEFGISILLVAGYYVGGQFRYGTTLGKKLFRIRVIRMDGRAMSLRQSWARFFGYLPSYALLGCGFFMVAFHPRKRGLHDLIAGTVSVITE